MKVATVKLKNIRQLNDKQLDREAKWFLTMIGKGYGFKTHWLPSGFTVEVYK